MKQVLEKLIEHKSLHKQEAENILIRIAEGEGNEAQLAAFMTVYLMRTVTPDELAGFRSALLKVCTKINLPGEYAIDLCGTGGDGKNTFNISTLAAFVVAGAGGKVIKHGNYGVSSVSGSSNVMEYFGFKFSADESKLNQALEKNNVCFLHAPLFHPALKRVAPVRKALGMKTFFNMLGPLVNPAQPKFRVTGVFNLELARVYQYLMQETDEQFVILHSLDGYDELSLTAEAKLFVKNGEKMISPYDFGFERLSQAAINGGSTIETAAKIFTDVLQNKSTAAQKNVVVANAAIALQCLGKYENLSEAVSAAEESLLSGNALNVFTKTIESN
ncbi:anthranilate phosphoribosyltransferase [soil metagenome]